MAHRLTSRRSIGMGILAAVALSGVILARATVSSAVQGPTVVRGNVPGEWRYWGADAWSSRYSSLDQINASNFDSLQVAWTWSAGAFGPDEYYRTTPLYANGRLFTVAAPASVATAIDPPGARRYWSGDSTKAFAGRRRPAVRGPRAAYWNDWNRSGESHRRHAGYHRHRSTRSRGFRSEVRRNGVVDLMGGLGFPLVPLAVETGLADHQRRRSRPPRPARREVGPVKRSAPTAPSHRPGARSDRRQLARDHRRRLIVVGNSSISRLLPDPRSQPSGLHRGRFDIRTGDSSGSSPSFRSR